MVPKYSRADKRNRTQEKQDLFQRATYIDPLKALCFFQVNSVTNLFFQILDGEDISKILK